MLFSFLWRQMRSQRGAFLAIFLVSLVWSLDSTVWPYILRVVVDILTRYDADRQSVWTSLRLPVFLALGFWCFVEMGFRLQGFLLAKAMPKLEAAIRMQMFDYVQRHSPKYFNENFAGSLANKITDITTQVPMILQHMLTIFIPTFATCTIALFFFFEVNKWIALILAVWIVIHFTICFLFGKRCDRLEHDHSEARSGLLGHVVDSLTNNFAVNLFYRFAQEKAMVGRYQKIELNKNIHAKKTVEIMRLYLGIFTLLLGGVTINWVMFALWMNNEVTTGQIAQIFQGSWTVVMTMWWASIMLPAMFQSIGVAKQALSLLSVPSDIEDAPKATALVVKRGSITFDRVSFGYGLGSLFVNKSVQIHPGEKVGLVGYSGAGKSTFVNLILRFFSVTSGKILIDEQDIAGVTLASLRAAVTLIPQDPILFHRTLEENIRYSNIDASEQDILKAAKRAHCHEFISALPEGYQTLVGERGAKLSGGERQRIAIARAMLADTPILLLDEATSALDSLTESYIQESLEKLMEGRTTIAIAHRLSTLHKMDRILVFERGRIIEEGTHKQLLAKGGHYAELWRMQAGGFLPVIG